MKGKEKEGSESQSGARSPHSKANSPHSKVWPHAPLHKLTDAGAYMVTTGTHQKQHFFAGTNRLDALHFGLLKYAKLYGWQLEAWAVFPNHYHFVAQSPESGAVNLSTFLNHFHGRSADWLNKQDQSPGRKIWHNFWDSHLTYEKSYLARLNYVHQNPVKHGVVDRANLYHWCSAAWFERTASSSQINTIYSFKTDCLVINDSF